MQFKVLPSFVLITLASISGTTAARVAGLSQSTANYAGLSHLPATPPSATPAGQCNTGSLQCCQSVQSASTHPAAPLLGLLGVLVQGVDAMIGLSCSPLDVLGIAGNSCSAQPVCCENNQFNGIVAVGCTPANVNL